MGLHTFSDTTIKKNRFYIADPAKGLVKYNLEEFKKHWVSTQSDGEEKGIAMFLEPTPAFYEKKMDEEPKEERSFKFLFGYIKQYRKYYNSIKFNGMDINLENSIVNYIESICK